MESIFSQRSLERAGLKKVDIYVLAQINVLGYCTEHEFSEASKIPTSVRKSSLKRLRESGVRFNWNDR